VLSPLLANIYLNELDHLIDEKYRMVRYADDFVILATCEAEAERALVEVRGMDGLVRRRLRSILQKYQKKGGGTGRNIQDHRHWTNAYFASMGLFTMYEAHAEASQPR
jgi:Reverse transcriptase (RNA-dependent DNA polymerase)